jgi:hypothetical protein
MPSFVILTFTNFSSAAILDVVILSVLIADCH